MRKMYRVTSTERDGSDPITTLHATEEEAKSLVEWGNTFSMYRVYSYEVVEL